MQNLIHVENGHEYYKGCLPRLSKPGDGTFPVLDDSWLIPRSKWPDYYQQNLKGLIWHVIDQSNQGSCCGCATVGAAMLAREFAGLDRLVLSQASVYGLGNGGRDQGMAIDTGLQILLETGACPVDVIDQYDWQGYRNGTWPSNRIEVGARFRAVEVKDAPTLDHAVSGMWRGWIPVYGSDGHAVILVEYDGKKQPNVLGSWGKDYGDGGIHRWSIAQLESYGCWLLRVMVDPPDDGDLPGPQQRDQQIRAI